MVACANSGYQTLFPSLTLIRAWAMGTKLMLYLFTPTLGKNHATYEHSLLFMQYAYICQGAISDLCVCLWIYEPLTMHM